jgi:glycerol-3-phosphate acyltransferase PlsY
VIPALFVLAGPAAGTYGVAAALLIAVMHRANIARLRAGTESKLPLFRRSATRS